jgi:alpha-amylase/alpha-mannosidase (GH57 family)
MTRVGMLWHLHQPDYRDPRTGRPVMPWTRLHAVRGYLDMLAETASRGTPWTINVVPVLLAQLDHYASGGTDDHLDRTLCAADALDAADHLELRASFVCGNPAMIQSHPAYATLASRVASGERLTTADWRDLQVWSTLAWFGATARANFPVVDALRAKGRGFSEDDKHAMIAAQRAIVASLPDRVASLAARGQVSVSPLHHPILPLLVDLHHARRCGQRIPEALRYRWPMDARRELVGAREDLERRTGVAPVGLWPSEGSISPEVVALAAEAGFRWLASDDGVWSRSVTRGDRWGGQDLGHGVVGFFRDHALSDAIGFQHARMPVRDAVGSLVEGCRSRTRDGLVVLALDGENPWEAFPDAGAAYREALHAALCGPLEGVTLDAESGRPCAGRVEHLHTGSWIDADFHVWAGDDADLAAWSALAAVREAIEHAPHRDAGLRALAPAAGSDWAWWLGPEHHTPFAATFDTLFRAHLAAACSAAGVAWPIDLSQPTFGVHASAGTPPEGMLGFVEPGLVRPAAWWAAGMLALPTAGAMAGGRRALAAVRAGVAPDGRAWIALIPAAEGTYEVVVDGIATALRIPEVGWALPWPRTLSVRGLDEVGRRTPAEGEWALPEPPSQPNLRWWSV